MDKAEEYFQSKNGGKSSKLAYKHGELISPIWAVELLEQYASEVSREVAVEFELRHVYKGASKAGKKLTYMQYDEWIKNQ